MKYNSWLFLQDGNSEGFNISSIGLNLINNSVEKVITYKSFLKLIPNPAQDINVKSKLKKVAEWSFSGEYYHLYGWIDGQSSKINMHNFDLDEYPNQDFFGDLILFKLDPKNYHFIDITESDIHTIDIAKRENEEEDDDDYDNMEKDISSDEEDEKDENENGKSVKKAKEENTATDNESEDGSEEGSEDFNYEDDKEVDDNVEENDNLYEDDDDDDGSSVKIKKKPIPKSNICNFSRLISNNILKENLEKTNPLNDNPKQIFIIDNFHKLLFPSKIKEKLNKSEINVLRELERGIYNWTIRECDKNGIMCSWEDQNFIKIYNRKAISIYQNLSSDNIKLKQFTLIGDNAYKLSEMKPTELYPEKYQEILEKVKEKEKVIFEKRKGVGSQHYKCRKCNERDVAVTTAQTRSGDEGITLFLTCNNCGNQWKMS